MATQTGEVQIDAIEGNVVRGHFRSVYEKNVYSANTGWGAACLYDAFQSLAGLDRVEDELKQAITAVRFTSPNTASTTFEIEVSDPSVLEGLTTGYWESYYIG